jgi:hypothetical protein
MASEYVPAAANSGNNINIITTDEPYGKSNGGSIIVARIPGNTAPEIAKYLQNAIARRGITTTKTMIVATNTNVPSDYFFDAAADTISAAVSGSACSKDSNCYPAPQYCLGSGTCSNYEQLQLLLGGTNIQVFLCHGNPDGFLCSDYLGWYPVLATVAQVYPTKTWYSSLYAPSSASMVSVFPIPTLNQYPVILMGACFGAILIPSQATLATLMLDQGASAYVGGTTEMEYPPASSELSTIYSQFASGGKTIGQAVWAAKSATSINPYGVSDAAETQLYGDPTLKLSG